MQAFAPGDTRLARYRHVLDALPPEFTTVWIEDHLQKGDRELLEGWTLLTYLAALYPRYRFGHLPSARAFGRPHEIPRSHCGEIGRPFERSH